MNRDRAIDLLLARLGQRGNDAVLKAAAVTEMALMQENLERQAFKPWFLLSELRTVDTSANEERIALPDDFLEEPEEGAVWLLQPDNATTPKKELIKTDYDVALQRFPIPAIPRFYSLGGNYLRIHPTPDAVYTLQTQFYVKQTQLTDVYGSADGLLTNNWLTYASDWLMAETGALLAATYTRDTELATIFQAQASVAHKRCYTETIQRQEANYNRQMGDD